MLAATNLGARARLHAANRAAPMVSILMYHQVGEFSAPKVHRAGYCHVRRFAAQMNYLRRFAYSVISLEQALAGLFDNARLPQRPVVLTFDDGYQNFYEHAWPILQRHAYPASVFLIVDLIGKTGDWLNHPGRAAPPMMTAATLRKLRAAGVSFGSHTMSHARLSQIDARQQRGEISDSKRRLEDLFGETILDFCYPFGDYDARARDLVVEAGYRSALTCTRGAGNTADNAFEIPRKAISYGDTLIGYFWKLHMKHRRKDRADAGS